MQPMTYDLTGKSVVITGATSGIGLAAATRFAQLGAFVIGIGRSEARIQQAENNLRNLNPTGDVVVYLLADLADRSKVRKLGESISSILAENHFNHLDVLINNAGVYLERKHMTHDHVEMTFAVNHLAAFILTNEVLPLLKRSKMGRVLTVSSYSHRTTPLNLKRITNPFPYIGLLAYKRSKLCNILFTNELNRRNPQIEGFSVDPGLVNTSIASKGKPGPSDWVWQIRRHKGSNTDVPVETLLFLSSNQQIDTKNGHHFRECQAEVPSRNARNKKLARELWALSYQLTGIEWD